MKYWLMMFKLLLHLLGVPYQIYCTTTCFAIITAFFFKFYIIISVLR